MTEELRNFLKEGLNKGFSIEELRNRLINSGWSIERVNEEIRKLNNLSQNNLKQNPEKKRPFGIKLITYFHYFAIPLLIISSSIVSYLNQKEMISLLGSFSSSEVFSGSNFIIASLIFPLIISIIPIVAGRNLWKGKRGDRIFVIIVAFLVLFFSLFSITSSIFSVLYFIIAIIVLYYLLIDKKTKNWFK